MKKQIKRKEFDNIFSEYNVNSKKVWAITKIKMLDSEIIDIVIRLANLDFINYVRITNEKISASNEIKGTRIKEPVTTMNHPTAIGIEIIYHKEYRILDFNEINSPIKGNGSKLVAAVLENLPKEWSLAVVMDWSNGFWDKMKNKYNDREWIL